MNKFSIIKHLSCFLLLRSLSLLCFLSKFRLVVLLVLSFVVYCVVQFRFSFFLCCLCYYCYYYHLFCNKNYKFCSRNWKYHDSIIRIFFRYSIYVRSFIFTTRKNYLLSSAFIFSLRKLETEKSTILTNILSHTHVDVYRRDYYELT